jgi:hypothetical protein
MGYSPSDFLVTQDVPGSDGGTDNSSYYDGGDMDLYNGGDIGTSIDDSGDLSVLSSSGGAADYTDESDGDEGF